MLYEQNNTYFMKTHDIKIDERYTIRNLKKISTKLDLFAISVKNYVVLHELKFRRQKIRTKIDPVRVHTSQAFSRSLSLFLPSICTHVCVHTINVYLNNRPCNPSARFVLPLHARSVHTHHRHARQWSICYFFSFGWYKIQSRSETRSEDSRPADRFISKFRGVNTENVSRSKNSNAH